jgi:phosphate transport system protein
MDRQIDQHITALKQQIVSMGGYVERAIEEVTFALTKRDLNRLTAIPKFEEEINKLHISIDKACLNLLARQSPLASDLRLILAIVKINTDLERMGDQAFNICQNAHQYLTVTPVTIRFDFTALTTEVRAMVRDCLDAFMKMDVALANHVLDHDDVVDEMKDQIFAELVEYIQLNPKDTEQALSLILIARNLERLGDHATNIAEDVIFVATGEDVRHGGIR